MKKFNFLTVFFLLFISFALSSCEAIAGIFKAGMGFGIFLVVAIVGIVVYIAMRAGKNKK